MARPKSVSIDLTYSCAVDVLLGMMAGADLFETDFPLQLAQQGLVLQLKTKGYEQSIDYVTQLKAASKSIDTVADSALSLALISEKLNEQ